MNQLTEAADYWQKYTGVATLQYANPFWTNRVGHVDWQQLGQEVLHDMEIAGSERY